MSFLWIALAVAIGGVVKGLIGWSRSQDPFDGRKFIGTALTTVIASVAVAIAYSNVIIVSIPDVALAFLAGVGADNLRKELVDNVKARANGKGDLNGK